MATPKDLFLFRGKFTEFATTNDGDIAAVLNTADMFLDPVAWGTDPASVSDFNLARMYWSAHWLSLVQQQVANATIDGTGMSDLFVRQISIGERRVAFQQRKSFEKIEEAAGPGEAMLSNTIYGQMYLQLRARNFPLVAIV